MENKKKIKITEEYFHNVLNFYDRCYLIKKDLEYCFENQIVLSERIKSNKGKETFAIKADELNLKLRALIEFKFESQLVGEKKNNLIRKGVSTICGFDFLIFDQNLQKLKSYLELEKEENFNLFNELKKENPIIPEIEEEERKRNNNITSTEYNLNTFLFAGEFQFGNWALVYRDFFRVLKPYNQDNLDCLIYIVATGSLESMLSSGIVTFDKVKKVLSEFQEVVKIPIYVLGIDFVCD